MRISESKLRNIIRDVIFESAMPSDIEFEEKSSGRGFILVYSPKDRRLGSFEWDSDGTKPGKVYHRSPTSRMAEKLGLAEDQISAKRLIANKIATITREKDLPFLARGLKRIGTGGKERIYDSAQVEERVVKLTGSDLRRIIREEAATLLSQETEEKKK